MKSVFDELNERIAEDPRLTRRGGPRVDVGLLLVNYKDELRDLWVAAERCARTMGGGAPEDMRAAVEKLRPFYGERP